MELFYILQPALIGSALAAFYITHLTQREHTREQVKVNTLFLFACAFLIALRSVVAGFEGLLNGDMFVGWYLMIKLYLILLFINQFNSITEIKRKDYLMFFGVVLLLNDLAAPFYLLDQVGELLVWINDNTITRFVASVFNWFYEMFREYRNVKL